MTSRKKSAARKRVLLVDDHPMTREGLAQLIGNQPDLEVCGEAGDAFEALEKIGLLKPDLVLSDITLPGKNGLELIKDIHSMHPGVMVLVISMHDEALYVERVLRAGGRGYVMKQEGGKRSRRRFVRCWRDVSMSVKKCRQRFWRFFPDTARNWALRQSKS